MISRFLPSISAIFLATAITSQGTVLVNEPFAGYIPDAELGGTTNQVALGTGLAGTWMGSGYFKSVSTGLSMAGVASSGGSAYLLNPGNFSKQLDVSFSTPLDSGTFYGSYLFSLTHNGSTGKTAGGIGVGFNGATDNTASFIWAGDGYNNNANNVEGPGIRAVGSAWTSPTLSLTSAQTYIYLYQFDASAGTTSGWVLSESQLANFYGSLDAATLNAAATDTTDANGVTWRGTASATGFLPTSNLVLFGLGSTDASFGFYSDEIRISDSSLFEAVTVPEPSTIALVGFGIIAFGRVACRRRKF